MTIRPIPAGYAETTNDAARIDAHNAALATKPAAPAEVASEPVSPLDRQIARAQEAMKSWSPEKHASMQLQGPSDTAPRVRPIALHVSRPECRDGRWLIRAEYGSQMDAIAAEDWIGGATPPTPAAVTEGASTKLIAQLDEWERTGELKARAWGALRDQEREIDRLRGLIATPHPAVAVPGSLTPAAHAARLWMNPSKGDAVFRCGYNAGLDAMVAALPTTSTAAQPGSAS